MSNSHVSYWYREFHRQFWRKSRKPTPHESDTLLKEGAGNGKPDFISWFKQKVQSNLARTDITSCLYMQIIKRTTLLELVGPNRSVYECRVETGCQWLFL